MDVDPKTIGEAVARRRRQLGWSQDQLASASGSSQSTVDRIEKGQFKRLPSDLPAIAHALDLDIPAVNLARIGVPDGRAARQELPVFAAAEGGAGEMVVSTDPIEFVPRPWYMREVRDGYAVLVVGESMIPVFEPGDMAIVNPRLPPIRGKDMIFIGNEAAGEFRASIKRLVSWTEKEWRVQQFNRPKEFTMARQKWPKALRVVGKFYGG